MIALQRTPLALSFLSGFLLLLINCGGGGDNSTAGIEGTGSPVATSSSVEASGSVTGFGSIFVNGIKFETDKTSFTVNGESAPEEAIQVGMYVHIEGARDKQTGESQASKITYERSLFGPISAVDEIDSMTKHITVLGQQVEISSDIIFDGVEFESLATNLTVELSGFDSSDNIFQATRIELATDSHEHIAYALNGKVSELNQAASTFNIKSQIIHFDAARFINGTADQLSDNVNIRVESTSINVDGSLRADSIEFKNERSAKADTIVSKEGTVKSFTSISSFFVNNQEIDASLAKVLRGTIEQLADGVHVTIEGQINPEGILKADTLRLKLPDKIRVSGLVESVNTTTNEITVLDTTFKIDAITVYDDRRNNANRFININDISVGDYLHVFGKTIDDQLIAVKIKRENTSASVTTTITGPITRVESDTLFYVMGIMVDVTNADGIELIRSARKGAKVEVEGIQIAPKSIVASRISLVCTNRKKAGCEDEEAEDKEDKEDKDSKERKD